MKPQDIKLIDFHRNGVMGECFYTIYLDYKYSGESYNMIMTTTTEKEISKTRCITPDSPTLHWRGDQIHREVWDVCNKMIKSHKLRDFYDLVVMFQK